MSQQHPFVAEGQAQDGVGRTGGVGTIQIGASGLQYLAACQAETLSLRPEAARAEQGQFRRLTVIFPSVRLAPPGEVEQ